MAGMVGFSVNDMVLSRVDYYIGNEVVIEAGETVLVIVGILKGEVTLMYEVEGVYEELKVNSPVLMPEWDLIPI